MNSATLAGLLIVHMCCCLYAAGLVIMAVGGQNAAGQGQNKTAADQKAQVRLALAGLTCHPVVFHD
jgi:hypothetical protein